ncbi:MAG: S8 family serine peptidase [Chloroflexi bacterium]|nr:S8 family serine peptidase [Chloroflexota bacterium]
MKYRRLVVLLVLVLALVAVLPAAQAQTVKPNVYVSEGVAQALKSGPANVLVTLDVPVSSNLQQVRDSVAAAQATVLNALNPRTYALRAQYSHVAVLSMSIEPEALAVLTGLPNVRAINLDQERFLSDLESNTITQISDVHTSGYTGVGTRVAVVDSGINGTHVNLSDDLYYEACFRTEADCPAGTSGPGSALDQDGHGTHVSGIVTGSGGTAPDAEIIALKVFTLGSTSDTNILNALNAVISNDATWQTNVVNMSLGGGNYATQAACDLDNASYVTAFANLNALGIAVFVSTGNDASIVDVSAPGCVTGAIGVGSTSDAVFTATFSVCTENGQPDKVTCYSNTTATQGAGELMDILAPGCLITSEWTGSPTAMDTICGTSMASPTAAGIAATLLSLDPSLTPTQLEDLIESTGDPIVDYRNSVTYPRINAASAFAALAITLPTPTNLVATPINATQIDLTWDDIAGEDQYEVQRSPDGAGWAPLGTTGTDVTALSDLATLCGTNYYRVRGVDTTGPGYSQWSNVATATTRACPLAPTSLAATILTSSSVQLDWADNATDETAYHVERSDNGGPWGNLVSLPADSITHTDSGFACGQYSYRVRAERSGDFSAYSNEVTVGPCAPDNDLIENVEVVTGDYLDVEPNIRYATISPSDPSPSCRFAGPAQGSNSVWYSITPVGPISLSVDTLSSDITGGGNPAFNDTILAIYTGTPGSLTQVACNDDFSGANLLSQISNFTMNGGTTYYIYVTRWSVVPMSFDGTLRVNFVINEAPPVLSATGVVDGVDLSWTSVASATEYRVERKPALSGAFAEIATVPAPTTTHTDTPITPCAVYDYRVRSYNSGTASFGVYSNVVRMEPSNCNLAPDNDFAQNAEVVSSFPSTDTESGVPYATISAGDPTVQTMGDCTIGFPRTGTNSIWYQYTPSGDGVFDINTNGSSGSAADTMIAIFTGTYSALTQVACDDESGTGSQSLINDFPMSGGTTYLVLVARWSSTATTSAGTFVVNFDFVPDAPGDFTLTSPADASVYTLPTVPTSFEWTASSGADTYTFTVNDGVSDIITQTGIASTSTTLDAGEQALLVAGSYTWSVTAVNITGNTAASNAPFDFTVDPAPVLPGAFTLTSPADASVYTLPTVPTSFEWTASSDADTYTFTVNDGVSDIITQTGIAGTSTTLDAGEQALLVAGSYTWSVTAVNTDGNTTASNAPFGFTINPPLVPPGAFTLTSPADASVYNLPTVPTTFEWTASSDADTYTFTVNDGASDIITIASLVTNSATLDAGQQAQLGIGSYTWSVTAYNTDGNTTASNAPFGFDVTPEQAERLLNGSFETAGASESEAADWTGKLLTTKDKRVCGKPNFPATDGSCVFRFKFGVGASPSRNLSQTHTAPAWGNTGEHLDLSVYAAAKNLTAGAKVIFNVKYTDDTKSKVTLDLPTGTYAATEFTGDIDILLQVAKVKVKIKPGAATGSFWLDDMSMLWTQAIPREVVRSDVLPVPVAPNGFRGKN